MGVLMARRKREPLPDMTPEQVRVWRSACRIVGLAVAIYLVTLVGIVVGEFAYATWTPPRGLFMTSFILMTGLTVMPLTEGRAKPQTLKVSHAVPSLVVAVVWAGICLGLFLMWRAGA